MRPRGLRFKTRLAQLRKFCASRLPPSWLDAINKRYMANSRCSWAGLPADLLVEISARADLDAVIALRSTCRSVTGGCDTRRCKKVLVLAEQ